MPRVLPAALVTVPGPGARHADGANIRRPARLWRHSSVITVMRKETCDERASPCCSPQAGYVG